MDSAGTVAGTEDRITTADMADGQMTTAVRPGRVVSLDVFRGVTIAAMILVNNAGGPMYGPLDHAEWNGWTHTDLIFPFFMFMAGASMALSFAARTTNSETTETTDPTLRAKNAARRMGHTRQKLILHTVRRGLTIIGIGLWLNLFPWFFDAQHYANLRIPGVLQRIGFCYIFAGVIYLWTSFQGSTASDSALTLGSRSTALASRSPDRSDNVHSRRRGPYVRAGIIAALLLGYWTAMKLIPVPGVGAGDLSPNNNLGAYIDNMIFGARHMWQHRPWDPEGLLSSVPALCTMLLGTFVGELLSSQFSVVSGQENSSQSSTIGHQQDRVAPSGAQESKSKALPFDSELTFPAQGDRPQLEQSTWRYKVKQLVLWGALFVVAGEVWGIWFPINKALWTSSYVVFTAGYAMLALAAVYWVVDVRGWRRWTTPFLVFGTNAILAFTLSTWVTKFLLVMRVPSGRVVNGQAQSVSAWSWVITHSWHGHLGDPRNAALAFALSYVLIWMAVMWWFYKRRIFVKI